MKTKQLLSQFPITFEFVAIAAYSMKGISVEHWRKELEKYFVQGQCSCGKCQSFYLETNETEEGLFECGCMYEHFGKDGDTLVVLRHNMNGHLNEVELPQISNIPFKTEYRHLLDEDYQSKHTVEEARKITKKWFGANPHFEPQVLLIDD